MTTVYLNLTLFPGDSETVLEGTDILYLRVMGDDVVALSSNEVISDLLEKRSSIYSDRVSCTAILTIRS